MTSKGASAAAYPNSDGRRCSFIPDDLVEVKLEQGLTLKRSPSEEKPAHVKVEDEHVYEYLSSLQTKTGSLTLPFELPMMLWDGADLVGTSFVVYSKEGSPLFKPNAFAFSEHPSLTIRYQFKRSNKWRMCTVDGHHQGSKYQMQRAVAYGKVLVSGKPYLANAGIYPQLLRQTVVMFRLVDGQEDKVFPIILVKVRDSEDAENHGEEEAETSAPAEGSSSMASQTSARQNQSACKPRRDSISAPEPKKTPAPTQSRSRGIPDLITPPAVPMSRVGKKRDRSEERRVQNAAPTPAPVPAPPLRQSNPTVKLPSLDKLLEDGPNKYLAPGRPKNEPVPVQSSSSGHSVPPTPAPAPAPQLHQSIPTVKPPSLDKVPKDGPNKYLAPRRPKNEPVPVQSSSSGHSVPPTPAPAPARPVRQSNPTVKPPSLDKVPKDGPDKYLAPRRPKKESVPVQPSSSGIDIAPRPRVGLAHPGTPALASTPAPTTTAASSRSGQGTGMASAVTTGEGSALSMKSPAGKQSQHYYFSPALKQEGGVRLSSLGATSAQPKASPYKPRFLSPFAGKGTSAAGGPSGRLSYGNPPTPGADSSGALMGMPLPNFTLPDSARMASQVLLPMLQPLGGAGSATSGFTSTPGAHGFYA